MVEENQNQEPNYEDLVSEQPERDFPNEPPSLDSLAVSASEAEPEEDLSHKTDIQTILANLTPKFATKRMNDLLQPVMVSRIFPDNYTDKMFLISASIIEESEDFPDVIGIISNVQDACSIGFEGRGIVDRLEIAGVVHEESMEKISNELGLGR